MSRNSTWYSIVQYNNDDPPDLLFFAECRTAIQARRIAAANPGVTVKRWHYTQSSGKYLGDARGRNTRGMLRAQRLYRKLRRREADKTKVKTKIDWRFWRLVKGVRKGTIL